MTSANPARVDADRELVRRMLDGDRRAFDEFTDDYLPQLYRFASRRLAGDRELVVEVVQSTVCKALSKLASFRGEAALMTWLCAVCRNEIAAQFRQLGRRRMESDFETLEQTAPAGGLPLGSSGIDGPERAAERRESAARVHDSLDALSPRYAQVLEWKYIEEIPVAEIAGRLDVSAKAAESLLSRARAAFRDHWGELTPSLPRAGSQMPQPGRVMMTHRGSR